MALSTGFRIRCTAARRVCLTLPGEQVSEKVAALADWIESLNLPVILANHEQDVARPEKPGSRRQSLIQPVAARCIPALSPR